ncbi:MAG: 2-hydroxyacyl-CoA dehydratase subunit D [Myxococcota bacterium]
MSLLGMLRYGIGCVGGRAMLRLERLGLERRMRAPGFWKSEHLSSPLAVSPRLKELISRHYLDGRFAQGARKVAWVTSGAPVEVLVALGYLTIYPENHGAVCGIRRTAEELCETAEDAGYSRDICSYARTDFGCVLSGKTPVGRLPPPDILVCCTNICQTVLHWYQVLAHHFDVPLVLIDTPFLYGDAPAHAVDFVERQLDASVPVMERVAGKELSDARLREVTRCSRQACELWLKVIESGTARPAPITAFDQFIHLAPIVEMRGRGFTVDYYAALLREIEERKAAGVGALKNERKRVVWDNLPIWYRVRWMGDLLAERGVAMVTSTYTNAWGELAEMIDPQRPMQSAARVYLHPILNRGTGHKLATMQRMVRDYSADGVLLHSDRSCKPYSIGQISQRDRLAAAGVPALLLEADHNDPRAFSEEQARSRIEAFLEMMGA